MTMALWEVSAMSVSQRCDPMNPPPPIKQIVKGLISLPSKLNLAIVKQNEEWRIAEKEKENVERKREGRS